MAPKTAAPCGSWRSPITSDLLAEAGPVYFKFSDLQAGNGGVFWIEGRPQEDGRDAVCFSARSGEVRTITPSGFNARTRCNEYGGGAFLVHESTVFFSHFEDQRVYRQDGEEKPFPITPDAPKTAAFRYADGRTSPDGKLIVCVRERHERGKVFNEIVVLPTDGSIAPRVIASGSDFYSFPRISADGRRLAWTQWNHRNMPWDGTELMRAELSSDGTLTGEHLVAGGPGESIFQPDWSPSGELYFVSDRTGWWNIYSESEGVVEAVCPMEAEFGAPQWMFGMSRFALLSDERILASVTDAGIDRLVLIHDGEAIDVDLPYSAYHLESLCSDGQRVWFIAASHTEAPAIVCFDPDSSSAEVVRASTDISIEEGFVSIPRRIEFPTDAGTAHGFFYPPTNPSFSPRAGEKPPLRVAVHGGPTSREPAGIDLDWQFYTSRGWAVMVVNYGGSTGYGRAYRERLRGAWGVVDRADAAAAARYLIDQGEVDPSRIVISGGSAGGYTTLLSLCLEDVYAAGISYFGISDLESWAADTHNFESHYCDGLVGRYPKEAAVYRERSPVNLADRIRSPLLILQGADDEVVGPSQAVQMLGALDANQVPHAYVEFAGEGHGFRKEDTVKRSLDAELYFLSRILSLPLAEDEDVEPIQIHNL